MGFGFDDETTQLWNYFSFPTVCLGGIAGQDYLQPQIAGGNATMVASDNRLRSDAQNINRLKSEWEALNYFQVCVIRDIAFYM